MVLPRRILPAASMSSTEEGKLGLEEDPYRCRLKENHLVLPEPPATASPSKAQGGAGGNTNAPAWASAPAHKKKRGEDELVGKRTERALFSTGGGAGAAQGGASATDAEAGGDIRSARKPTPSPTRLEAADTAVKPLAPRKVRGQAKNEPKLPRAISKDAYQPPPPASRRVGKERTTTAEQHPSLTPNAEVSIPLTAKMLY